MVFSTGAEGKVVWGGGNLSVDALRSVDVVGVGPGIGNML